MTIYKPKPEEKKEVAGLPPEVVINEPLMGKTKTVKPRTIPVAFITVAQRRPGREHRRSRTFVNWCISLNVLMLAIAALLGSLYLYKHMRKSVYSDTYTCEVRYYELQEDFYRGVPLEVREPQAEHRIEGQFDEQVELDVDGLYERIDVPDFLDCRRSTILHDFERNSTAVIDKDFARCFVMPLDHDMVKPPKDFLDLIVKLKTGYYLPDEQVVRQKFYVKLPPVEDLSSFGFHIYKQCRFYDTYELVPSSAVNQDRTRRSAMRCDFANTHYTFTGAAGAERLGIADIMGCA